MVIVITGWKIRIIQCYCDIVKNRRMSKLPQEDSFEKPANKNIKNIYVHKINSLIKISRDSLAVDQIDVLPQNKMTSNRIKKTYSETDKTALKLEKNRESARKARQRKNLYIKLLQNQVAFLRKQLAESEAVETSSTKYLNEIKNVCKEPCIKRQSSVEQELDRYISQDNLPNLGESKERNDKKCLRLNQTIEQFKHWFVPELFKGINNLKKSQRADINSKIFKNAVTQFQNMTKYFKNKTEHSLRVLLPFQDSTPDLKITNIMRTLNKYMEELQNNLQKLSQITCQAQQLIMNQELCELDFSEVEATRVKSIVWDMAICGIGDRPDKFLERALRWQQFPVADILKTMEKIVEFNKFIESANGAEYEIEIEKKRQPKEEMH